MTPKEKAQELYETTEQMLGEFSEFHTDEDVKIIVRFNIEEIMKAEEAMWNESQKAFGATGISYNITFYYTYWQEVLKELDKI